MSQNYYMRSNVYWFRQCRKFCQIIWCAKNIIYKISWYKKLHKVFSVYAPVGFPSLCLEMSMLDNSAISAILVVLECICTLCMFVESWDCFEAKLHCNESLVVPFETAFETSQSLASIGQPITIGHVRRIIRGHNILVTSQVLVCNQHMVHEND